YTDSPYLYLMSPTSFITSTATFTCTSPALYILYIYITSALITTIAAHVLTVYYCCSCSYCSYHLYLISYCIYPIYLFLYYRYTYAHTLHSSAFALLVRC